MASRKKLFVLLGIGAAAIAAFVLYWFQPQALFLNTRVNEAAPVAMEKSPIDGSFRSLAHTTTGKAVIVHGEDGKNFVRFEDFETSNGPDLFVYLSTAPATSSENTFAEDFIDLGRLEANIGNQNYEIPAGTDIAKYKSVVIWCKRFKTGFGVAPVGSTSET